MKDRFCCPHCQEKVDLPDGTGQESVPCPACGETVPIAEVASMDAQESNASVPSASGEPPGPSDESRPAKKKRGWFALSEEERRKITSRERRGRYQVLAGILVVSLLVLVGYMRNRHITQDNWKQAMNEFTAPKSARPHAEPQTSMESVAEAQAFPDVPIEIKPDANTDEQEFFIYNYKKLRADVPATMFNRRQDQQSLSQLRDRVNKYHEYINWTAPLSVAKLP